MWGFYDWILFSCFSSKRVLKEIQANDLLLWETLLPHWKSALAKSNIW